MNIRPGTRVKSYEIIELIGRGGMADVYKARHVELDVNFAIKFIRVDRFPPDILQNVIQRFKNEAKRMAKLSHSNIVKVTDFGRHEGIPYLVMEYLPGGTLKKYLGKPMPYQQAARLLLPIAKALAYAHAKVVVHRDVKPANVLISEDGQPMLSDFGVAKIMDSGETQGLTTTGAAIGTPEYMAPEQAMGKHIDHRVDIYSLGIIFYELVTGRRPFTADTPMEVVVKQSTQPVPPPSKYVKDLPEEVEGMLFKALAKKTEERYSEMSAMVAALQELLFGASPTKHPLTMNKPTPPVKKKQSIRLILENKNLGWLPYALASIIVLAIFFSLGLINKGEVSKVASPVDIQSTSLEEAIKTEVVNTVEIIPALEKVWDESICQIAFASNRDENSEIFLMDSNGNHQLQLTYNDSDDWGPTWSPDGSSIAFYSTRSGDYEIFIMDVLGGIQRHLNTHGSGDRYPAWSPDGTSIAFTSNRDGDDEIFVVDVSGGTPSQLTFNNDWDKYPTWSPDGTSIAFASNRDGDTEIFIMDVDGNNPRQLTLNDNWDGWPSWSPVCQQ